MANKENSGALFNNEDNKTSEKAPDYSGTVNVEGREYKLAGWIQEGQNGKKGFLSLKVTPADQQNPAQNQRGNNNGYNKSSNNTRRF